MEISEVCIMPGVTEDKAVNVVTVGTVSSVCLVVILAMGARVTGDIINRAVDRVVRTQRWWTNTSADYVFL